MDVVIYVSEVAAWSTPPELQSTSETLRPSGAILSEWFVRRLSDEWHIALVLVGLDGLVQRRPVDRTDYDAKSVRPFALSS